MITDPYDADEDRRLVAWLRNGEIAIDCRVTDEVAVVMKAIVSLGIVPRVGDLEWYGMTITTERARRFRNELESLLIVINGDRFGIATGRLHRKMSATLAGRRLVDTTMVYHLRKKVRRAAVRLNVEDRVAVQLNLDEHVLGRVSFG